MSAVSFEYRAVDRSGASTRGVIEAPSPESAYRTLLGSGLTPVAVRAASSGRSRSRAGRTRVKSSDISTFTHQLAVLLEARIPVVDCFISLSQQGSSERLRAVASEIAARVQGGSNITQAFEPHASVFGVVYIETIRAAERTGNLIKVLDHLAEMVEEQQEMHRQIKGALTYPVAVVVALSLAVGFLVTFVVPRFAHMFESRGVTLPLLTRVLMIVGDSVRDYWYLCLVAAAVGVVGARRLWARPKARLALDRYLHMVPYLREFLVGLASARFASVLGLALRSGLGLIESLEMSGRSSGRPMLAEDTRLMVRSVHQGKRLSDVLPACGYLPSFVTQLLRAGEESGELPRMCEVISRHYTRETRHMARTSSTIIEPLLIAGLTGVVLVVALAVFLPMWDMVTLMG